MLTYLLSLLNGRQAHRLLRLLGVRIADAHDYLPFCPCGAGDDEDCEL